MKFYIFLLVVSSYLVASSVNAALSSSSIETDFNYKFGENDLESMSDVERSVWSTLDNVIQKALKATRGVACAVKEVFEVKSAALNFIGDIQICGLGIIGSDKMTTLIEISKKIISKCNDIFHINKNICGNFNTEASDNSKTPEICLKKLNEQTVDLKDTIYEMISIIPDNTKDCIYAAITGLKNVLYEFPNQIRKCAKLVTDIK